MGILSPIVQALMRAVLDAGHDFLFCCAGGSELAAGHHARRLSRAFQKVARQVSGRLGVAAALHQNAQDETVMILGAP